MWKLIGVAALALSLGGCAWIMNGVSRVEDVDIASAEPLFQESRAWQPFQDVYEEAHTLRGDPDSCEKALEAELSTPPGGKVPGCNPESVLGLRNAALKAAQDAQPDQTKLVAAQNAATVYFVAGANLSDMLCNEWFVRLYRSDVAMLETSDAFANTGAAAATMMPLFGAARETTAGVSAGMNWFRQGTLDLNKNYVIAPDLGHVQRLVTNYRADYYKAKIGTDDVKNYFTATGLLTTYHATCSSAFVKALINRSVDLTLGVIEEEDPYQKIVLQYVADLLNSKNYFTTTVNEADIPYIFAREFSSKVGADAVASNINTYLSGKGLYKITAGSTTAPILRTKTIPGETQLPTEVDVRDFLNTENGGNLEQLTAAAKRLVQKLTTSPTTTTTAATPTAATNSGLQ